MPDELEERVVSTVAAVLAATDDDTVRMVAVTILAYRSSSGAARGDALRAVLEGQAPGFSRRLAARGLARSTGAWRSEALAILRAHAPREADAEVRSEIEALLASAESSPN